MSQFTCLTIQSFTVITVLKLQPNNFCTKFWRSSDLIKGLYQILYILTNKWVKKVEICLITFFCVFFFASLGKNVKKWGKLEEKHKSGYSQSALPFYKILEYRLTAPPFFTMVRGKGSLKRLNRPDYDYTAQTYDVDHG